MKKNLKHDGRPLVSILCITFNQEKFIAQTLDSFLMQKTNFPFEIIIHDDASMDNTEKIIQKYVKSYKKIFRPIYEQINQYSKGKDEFINKMFRMSNGKYIAICEGDDYWSSPDKLQKQVDYLEHKPNYAICFHPVRVIIEDGSLKEYIYPDTSKKIDFTLKELLKGNFIQTNSVMYRRQKDYKNLPVNIKPRDWYSHLYHAQFGKIGFIDEVMSVYRRHPGSLWWSSYTNFDELWRKHGLSNLKLYTELLSMFRGKNIEYRNIILKHIENITNTLIRIDKKYGSKLFQEALIKFPDTIRQLITHQTNIIETDFNSIKEKDQKIIELYQANERNDKEIKMIKSSKFWKTRNLIAKLIGKEVI